MVIALQFDQINPCACKWKSSEAPVQTKGTELNEVYKEDEIKKIIGHANKYRSNEEQLQRV